MRAITGLNRHVIDVVAAQVPRKLEVRRTVLTERELPPLIDGEESTVCTSHRPGNAASLRVRGPVGVQAGGPVLRLPQPGGRRARGGNGGRLVHRRYRHRNVTRAVVPAIRDLYRKAIHVVPVGVGRSLIVGCGAESKLSLFAYAEVPAVGSRQPPGRHHGQVSLASGRIGRQKTLEVFRPVKSGRT